MLEYLIGETIRVNASFRNFQNNDLVDPTGMSFKVYTPTRTIIPQSVEIIRDSVGQYHVDYSIPNVKAEFIVAEFTGTIEGTSDRVAKKIPITWI